MDIYERGANPETEHEHYSGLSSFHKIIGPEPCSLTIEEALEEIECECQNCEEIKKSALEKGLTTPVLVLNHHLVGLVH